jgi:hypothetical protein
MSKNIIFEQNLNTTAEKKIYYKLKRKIIEEEIKPLRKRLIETEREINILRERINRMINPSIKLLREIRNKKK